MAKFRTKLLVIEAVQWWPPGDPRYDPEANPIAKPKAGQIQLGDIVATPDTNEAADWLYSVRTLQGLVWIHPGDWLVTRPDGERYPVKPVVFEEKYEPA